MTQRSILIIAQVALASAALASEVHETLPHGDFTGEVKPVLYVTDVERSAPFYRDVLGFEFDGFAGDEADPYYAEMVARRLKFGLHEPVRKSDQRGVGTQRLYFRVRDLEAHHRRVGIAGEGVEVGEVVHRSWMDYFVVSDPDGNEIVFAATDAARHTSRPWSREPRPLASAPGTGSTGSAAYLFGYAPREGETDAMEEGYRKHLEWHRSAQDSLPWYGWTVVQGDRPGFFIDGTFGVSFEQFEARPTPVADAADAQRTFLPHVEPRFRQILRYRPELSGSSSLERRTPSPVVQAIWVDGNVADARALEAALGSEPGRELGGVVYERLTGGRRPGYLILLPMSSLADFPENGSDPLAHLLELLSDAGQTSASLTIVTELWRYRPSLSLLPPAEAGAGLVGRATLGEDVPRSTSP